MSQHGVAVRLVALYNFKSIQKRLPVFMCLQLIWQIIIVQPFVPIIPEFNCTPINLNIPVFIGSCAMMRQNVRILADSSAS